ncbi:unnamed protein product [Gordionus sp. m RMFG-2023]|uniref:sodium/potassium-transporting ATPase subunit beta-like n=1 Tax=Gordionus sp. m RMFG-2023 TaxID=3053472 RepID=UPI0030E55310
MSSHNKDYYETKKERTKWEKISRAIWNPDRREFLGRTAASWAKITGAYIIFYSFLAGFFAIMMYIFLRTLNLYKPRYTLSGSIIGTNPGLGYRPHVDVEKNLIYFNPMKPSTYAPYVDDLNKYLLTYETSDQSEGEGFLNCDEQKKSNDQQVCRVDIKKVSSKCDKSTNFGYTEGSPCVLLKLNKIYGWKPRPYDDDKIPIEVGGKYRGRNVVIRCFGETAADKENIGELSYYPKDGIPEKYFPYLNQRGYQTPFVMVQFNQPERGVLINVVCKAFAGNIQHDKPNEEVKLKGAVHFELLID